MRERNIGAFLVVDDQCPIPPTLNAPRLLAGPLVDDDHWALPSSVPIPVALVDGRRTGRAL
jgi:hypothetical protein